MTETISALSYLQQRKIWTYTRIIKIKQNLEFLSIKDTLKVFDDFKNK